MKIIFEKLRYKNILSTGNVFTEIDFLKNKTTLISGRNGEGKSTMIEALVFGLYGKPFRKITKPQLVNTINEKELLVEVEFSIGGTKYMVRRGIKANILEIYRDGKLINQDAASKDYQAMLEKQILKISYKSFTQIVILGSATYVPFMDLATPARREIVEDLLDIQVFSVMNASVKDKASANKEAIREATRDMEILDAKIRALEEQVSTIQDSREAEVAKIKTKGAEAASLLTAKKKELEELDSTIESLYNAISDKESVRARRDKLRDIKSGMTQKRRAAEEDIAFYCEHDDCPTCRQSLDAAFKSHVMKERQEQLDAVDGAFAKLTEHLEANAARLEEISDVEDQIRKEAAKASSIKGEITFLQNSIRDLRKEIEERREAPSVDTSALESHRTARDALHIELGDLHREREVLAYGLILLKDTGIKARIIKQFIPIMNRLLNKYLHEFELFVDFQIDENFNETILSRYRDSFSYSSFSEGEKMRINLAILMAWRAVSKLRNSVTTNLLIMDEILDGPSDSFGVDSLIKIIHGIAEDTNVFVISHRGEVFADKFDGHLVFKKVKNFSESEVVS